MRPILKSPQAAAADLFAEDGARISVLALAEAIWVLDINYGFSARELADAVEMLLNHRDFVLQDSEAVGAALDLTADGLH